MKTKLKFEIRGFSQKYICLFSIVVIGIALTLQTCTGKLAQIIGWEGYVGNLMMQVIPVLFLVFVLKKLEPFVALGFTKKGLLKGMFLGWLMIVMSLLNINYYILRQYGIVMPPVTESITFILWMLMVGVFEEVLMRGIILNNMIKKWGNTRKGIYLAVFMSSILFGIAHLINLIEHPSLVVATAAQVVYASFIGMFFAAVYLRSKNICVIILYHALFDFANHFTEVFSKTVQVNQNTDISLANACVAIVLASAFSVMGLWLLRKVEVKSEKSVMIIESHSI